MRGFLSSLVVVLLCSCGGASHPGEMSASHHEEAARRDEAAADDAQGACGGGGLQSGLSCWSTAANHAADHRRMAAEHRAAARALLEAEERACVGIDAADRDSSPFDHRDDITSVARLTETVGGGQATSEHLVGATVVFRAVRGMTAEWLQREIDCHLARNDAVGHDMPEMPSCPLVPALSGRVRSTGDGFAVDIRGGDDAAAQEILRRAENLLSASGA